MKHILLSALLFAPIAARAQNANTCAAQSVVCGPITLSLSATTNTFVIPIPSQYGSVTVQLTGLTGSSAVITPKVSTDGTTYATGPLFFTPSGATQATASADGQYTITGLPRFVELAVTTAGTGSVSVTYSLSAVSPSAAAGGVASNVNVTNTPSVTTTTSSAPPINITPITIATTGTAVQFSAHTLLQGATICGQHVSGTSVVNNTGTVWVGNSSVTQGTGAPVQPGACVGYTDNQSSDFWVNGASGDGATMGAN